MCAGTARRGSPGAHRADQRGTDSGCWCTDGGRSPASASRREPESGRNPFPSAIRCRPRTEPRQSCQNSGTARFRSGTKPARRFPPGLPPGCGRAHNRRGSPLPLGAEEKDFHAIFQIPQKRPLSMIGSKTQGAGNGFSLTFPPNCPTMTIIREEVPKEQGEFSVFLGKSPLKIEKAHWGRGKRSGI